MSINWRFHFLEFPFIRDFTAFVSFPLSCAWAGDQYSFSRMTSCICRFQNSFVFLIWWIVSEMELEKSRTILHIRGQNCSLATRSHTQFHYIYKIPNTCLLLPNHLEMRSQKFGSLSPPVPRNPPTLPQLSSRISKRYKEKLLSLSLSKFMFFYFLLK